MTPLTGLPPELIELIFHGLGSIDDVHHFGRVCRKTYDVLQNRSAYVEIMRSIILQSSIHRFDVQLCRMLDLHNQLVKHFQDGHDPITPSSITPTVMGTGNAIMNQWETQLYEAITDGHYLRDDQRLRDELSKARVYDILARWQGLRVLQDLWVSRQLREADYLPGSCNFDADIFTATYEQLQKRDEEFACNHHEDYNSFNADQTARFYSAITGLWLLNEIRWVFAQFKYPHHNFYVPLRILDVCKGHLASQAQTPLLDQLDLYSVYTFLYQHLLPLNMMPFSDQNSCELPLTYPSNLQSTAEYNARFLQLCLTAGQTYLQPPDLIDLVIRTKLMKRSPFPNLHLPASTKIYMRPSNPVHYPPDRSLTENGSMPPSRRPLSSLAARELGLIQRSTVAQTSIDPVRDAVSNPHKGLFSLQDRLDDWLKDRCQKEFDRSARRDRLDVDGMFEECWKRDVRWQVWWWANSEEKARMKMERWRVR